MKQPHYRRNAGDLYQFNETDAETGASVPIAGAEPLAEIHALFDTSEEGATLLEHGSAEKVDQYLTGLEQDRVTTRINTRHTHVNTFNREVFGKEPKSSRIRELAASKLNV